MKSHSIAAFSPPRSMMIRTKATQSPAIAVSPISSQHSRQNCTASASACAQLPAATPPSAKTVNATGARSLASKSCASITSRKRRTRRVPNSVHTTRQPFSSLKTPSSTHPALCNDLKILASNRCNCFFVNIFKSSSIQMVYTRKNSAARPLFSIPSATIPRAKTPHVATTFELARAPFQFYAWIPIPIRKEARVAHLHFQLIRWQLLAVIDTRWEFCPAILVVPAGRITATHLAALRQGTVSGIARPRAWRWRSPRRAGHSSSAQRFFERLQTPAAFIPGYVVPQRSRALHQLARAGQSGQTDPRRHFLPLAIALARVISCTQFANTEPVTAAAGWGCWIPWEKFDQQLNEKNFSHLKPL